MDTHKRWKFWPFSGADGESGGHVKSLGFIYAWTATGPMWEFEFFRLFAVENRDGRTRWAVASFSLTMTRARWRMGKREDARHRRHVRRNFERTRAASTVR